MIEGEMGEHAFRLIEGIKVWEDEPTKPRRERLWINEGRKCHWCGEPTRLVSETSWDQATTDHVIPRYKGGSNDDDNLVSACRLCNNRRNYEDTSGLPEGHLLGKYKADGDKIAKMPKKVARISLTRDEKRAILSKSDLEVLREQRDQAMSRIRELEEKLSQCQNLHKQCEDKLNSMTVVKLVKMRIIRFLSE